MRRWIIINITLALMTFLLLACKNQNNNPIENTMNTAAKATESPVGIADGAAAEVTEPPKNDIMEEDYYLKMVSIENIIKTINDFYINRYRHSNLRGGQCLFENEEVNYDVYYAGDGYVTVKFNNNEDENQQLDSIFSITSSGLKHDKQISEKKLDSIQNAVNLPYLCSGSFTVTEDYGYYDGKDKLKNILALLIWFRYFDTSEKKQVYGDMSPIFHETTKAAKVCLLDFDDKSAHYDILVFTEDGYLYDASIEYVEEDALYEFFEMAEARYKVDDILNYNETFNSDKLLPGFMSYYNNAMKHIIGVIEADDIIIYPM